LPGRDPLWSNGVGAGSRTVAGVDAKFSARWILAEIGNRTGTGSATFTTATVTLD